MRREVAIENEVPAYIVFGDASLRDMARRRPSSMENFLKVHGVGKKKCDDYGEQFLGQIAAFCTEMEITVDVKADVDTKASTPAQKSASSGLSASVISAFPYFKAGDSIGETATKMGRAESTVQGYLTHFIRHEQITDPSPWVEAAMAKRIHLALEACGGERLAPVFEHLGGEISYDQIRVVANCLANVEMG